LWKIAISGWTLTIIWPRFAPLLELAQPFPYLIFRKYFVAFCALVHLINQFIIYKIIGKVDPVEPDGKVIDALEVLILAILAQKVILDEIHHVMLLL